MSYSYSGWEDEFEGLTKETGFSGSAGLGSRQPDEPSDEPLETNSVPTFTKEVVKKYTELTGNQDDDQTTTPVITETRATPSNLVSITKANKYIEEQKYSQTLKTKILDQIIRTDKPGAGLMNHLVSSSNYSGSDDIVIDRAGGIISVTSKKQPVSSSIFNFSEQPIGYTAPIKTDQQIINDFKNQYFSINLGLAKEAFTEFTKQQPSSLSDNEYQEIFDIHGYSGGSTKSNIERLRDIDNQNESKNIPTRLIIDMLVDQTLQANRKYNPSYDFGGTSRSILEKFFGYEENETRTIDDDKYDYDPEGVVGLSEEAIKNLLTNGVVDKEGKNILSDFSFDLKTKVSGNNLLEKISKHVNSRVSKYSSDTLEEGTGYIPDLTNSTILYDTYTGVGNFKFSAKVNDIRNMQGSKYNFKYTDPNGIVSFNKNKFGTNVSASKDFTIGGGLTGKLTLDSDIGLGTKFNFNQDDLFGIPNLDLKATAGFNNYGNSWNGSVNYEKNLFKKDDNRSLMFTGGADLKNQKAEAGLEYSFTSPSARADFGANYISGGYGQAYAGFSKEFKGGNPLKWFKK